MKLKKIICIVSLSCLLILLPAITVTSGSNHAPGATAKSSQGGSHCVAIGGMGMTNFGAVDPNTTMGTATGDLRGAVGATITSVSQGPGNTTQFHVQHHWVTESGDTLSIDPAVATSIQVAPGLFAITDYPVHLSGGTGKFAGATGDFTNIGEADVASGRLVFRYQGEVCFANHDDQ